MVRRKEPPVPLSHPRAGVAAGALSLLTLTGAAALPAAAPADSSGQPSAKLADHSVAFGKRVRMAGRAPGAYGRRLQLQLAVPGGTWRTVGSSTVGRGDRYAVGARLRSGGRLRVIVQPAGAPAPVVSRERHVAVRRRITVSRRKLHVRVGGPTAVRGHVLPRARDVRVRLQVRRSGRWATIDRGSSGSGGRYVLRDRRGATMSAPLRVVAAGGRGLARGVRRVGRLNVYRFAQASWYGPGLYGNRLGCGGTLTAGTLGVANKSLPCGTKVTLRHGHRSIRVRVIDRGPYVGGREYDLTSATANRLGFHGHGAILATR